MSDDGSMRQNPSVMPKTSAEHMNGWQLLGYSDGSQNDRYWGAKRSERPARRLAHLGSSGPISAILFLRA